MSDWCTALAAKEIFIRDFSKIRKYYKKNSTKSLNFENRERMEKKWKNPDDHFLEAIWKTRAFWKIFRSWKFEPFSFFFQNFQPRHNKSRNLKESLIFRWSDDLTELEVEFSERLRVASFFEPLFSRRVENRRKLRRSDELLRKRFECSSIAVMMA